MSEPDWKGPCPICGGERFKFARVLWPELISGWELAPAEVDYIDRQQGLCCQNCGGNLRSMALAAAILKSYGYAGNLDAFCKAPSNRALRVLEINPAGTLNPTLAQLPGHRLVAYPEYDMTKLRIEAESYDAVIHSDTLEHIESAQAGLAECRRVLNQDGRCFFTVPIVVGRLTRSRRGLRDTFHGAPGGESADLRVHTEFGADFWTEVLAAGFGSCVIHCIDYPAGLAVEARR